MMRSKILYTGMLAAAWVIVAGLLPGGCTMPTAQFSRQAPVIDTNRARIDATTRLLQATEDPRPATRVHAIEAIAQVLPDRAGPVVMQALRDEDPDVRSAGAMAAGELQMASAKDRLQEMAMFKTKGAEIDKAAYCSVLGALHRLGDTKRSVDFRELLSDPTESIRGQAAAGLAVTGDPRALPLLKKRMEVERAPLVTIQIIEAAARLGDSAAVRKLEGHANLPTDSGIMAMEAVGRLATPGAMDLLRMVAAKPEQAPLRKVVAYGALARLGDVTEESYAYCLESLERPRMVLTRAFRPHRLTIEAADVDRLQRCAAISLGWMRRQTAVPALQGVMVSTSDADIRVAAAMSVLRIVRPVAAPAAPAAATKAAPEQGVTRKQPRKPAVQSAGGKD